MIRILLHSWFNIYKGVQLGFCLRIETSFNTNLIMIPCDMSFLSVDRHHQAISFLEFIIIRMKTILKIVEIA